MLSNLDQTHALAQRLRCCKQRVVDSFRKHQKRKCFLNMSIGHGNCSRLLQLVAARLTQLVPIWSSRSEPSRGSTTGENLMGLSGLIWSYMARYALFDFSDTEKAQGLRLRLAVVTWTTQHDTCKRIASPTVRRVGLIPFGSNKSEPESLA
jgi:hypothetical protein